MLDFYIEGVRQGIISIVVILGLLTPIFAGYIIYSVLRVCRSTWRK